MHQASRRLAHQCDDDIQRECLPANLPLTVGQMMILSKQLGLWKGEIDIQEYWEAQATQARHLYIQYQQRLNRMMGQARLERRPLDQPIPHRVRFGTKRIFRRIFRVFRDKLRECISYKSCAFALSALNFSPLVGSFWTGKGDIHFCDAGVAASFARGRASVAKARAELSNASKCAFAAC